MPHHTRKRARIPAQTDTASVITARSESPGEPDSPAHLFPNHIKVSRDLNESLAIFLENYNKMVNHPDIAKPPYPLFPERLHLSVIEVLSAYFQALAQTPSLKSCESFTTIASFFKTSTALFTNKVDALVSTEPVPELPKPSYASVALQADAPTPPPAASPSPSSNDIATTGSGPTSHSPKPRSLHARKSSQPPRNNTPIPSKAERQVRLVACIANSPDAITSNNPRWKAVPTDCFATFSKDIQRLAPGCVPLGYRLNQKGNLIISFTPSTPRSLLMSNIWVVRGSFELASHVPLIFDTPWSTLHIANVPTRLNESSTVFSPLEILTTLKTNPALCALPITSQPRWLRHPSNITGPRSSVVFSFEDSDGAIARQLLKTPTFMFGRPVTVKPWINKPSINARAPRPAPAEPSSTAPRVSSDLAHMDI